MDMHQCQDPESFFTAVQIYDNFLYHYGHWEFPRDKISCLGMACLRLALKFERQLVIRISDIESVLRKEDVRFSQQQLNKMEFEVLSTLNFDLSFPTFTQLMERFLRLLDYDHSNEVRSLAQDISKFATNDSFFLGHWPSTLAASSVIISINIYERDNSPASISKTQKNAKDLLTFNIQMWNNIKMVSMTGLTIEVLKEPIHDLTTFMRENLVPDRLEGFDLDSIFTAKNFK